MSHFVLRFRRLITGIAVTTPGKPTRPCYGPREGGRHADIANPAHANQGQWQRRQRHYMNAALVVCCFAWVAMAAHAESWNPYVNQAMVGPAPLLPAEFNGTGVLSFNVGNTGSDELPLVANQEMTLVITLSDGEPDTADPLAALGGTWVGKFDWSYEASCRTYRAVQNQALPGSVSGIPSLGTITIQYQVKRNTTLAESSNGFNVNLQPPPYSNGYNTTDDDASSSYTYVRATKYGDAPASYGSAGAEINLFKDQEGHYLNYVFLGASVAHEAADQPSAAADGDDANGAEDGDGITFSTLTAGAAAVIPVALTVRDSDYSSGGRLNAWIDWNGDGDFADAGEKIANNILIAESETRNLAVNVPACAIVTRPTFARFRFGPNAGSTGVASYGEVEDYEITIGPQRVTLGDRVWTDTNGNGVQDAGEPGLTNVTVRLLDATNGVVAAAATDAAGAYLFANLPPATYQVEFEAPSQYVFTASDAAVASAPADSDSDRVTERTEPVSMAAGTTNLTLDASLYVPAALYGYLFVDRNSDLVRNDGDESVSNALVRLTVNGAVVASTSTGDDGFYQFANVPPGTVSVLVSRASATLLAVPATDDLMRNRALPTGADDAYVAYPVISGYGVLSSLPGEPLNFGFASYPLSTAMDMGVYASNNGVIIELWTNNESGYGDIAVYAWIDNAWVEVGRVPGSQVVGEFSNRYTVDARGLSADGAYNFKIVDEAGHVHYSDGPVAVQTVRVAAVRTDMQTMLLTFTTEAGRNYVVKVSPDMVHWTDEYVSCPTADGWSEPVNTPFPAGPGTQTQVRVPVNGRAKAFFKIVYVGK